MLLLPDGLLARASLLDSADCSVAYSWRAWQPGSVPLTLPGAGSLEATSPGHQAPSQGQAEDGLGHGACGQAGQGCGELEAGPAVVPLGQGQMTPGDNEMGSWTGWNVEALGGGSASGPLWLSSPSSRLCRVPLAAAAWLWAWGQTHLPALCWALPEGLLWVINLEFNQVPDCNASARRGWRLESGCAPGQLEMLQEC